MDLGKNLLINWSFDKNESIDVYFLFWNLKGVIFFIIMRKPHDWQKSGAWDLGLRAKVGGELGKSGPK